MKTYREFKDQGVLFLGLTPEGEDALMATKAYIEDLNIPWPNGYGAVATLQSLGVSAFPTEIVVGADGRIAWHDELDGELRDAIKAALSQASKS